MPKKVVRAVAATLMIAMAVLVPATAAQADPSGTEAVPAEAVQQDAPSTASLAALMDPGWG